MGRGNKAKNSKAEKQSSPVVEKAPEQQNFSARLMVISVTQKVTIERSSTVDGLKDVVKDFARWLEDELRLSIGAYEPDFASKWRWEMLGIPETRGTATFDYVLGRKDKLDVLVYPPEDKVLALAEAQVNARGRDSWAFEGRHLPYFNPTPLKAIAGNTTSEPQAQQQPKSDSEDDIPGFAPVKAVANSSADVSAKHSPPSLSVVTKSVPDDHDELYRPKTDIELQLAEIRQQLQDQDHRTSCLETENKVLRRDNENLKKEIKAQSQQIATLQKENEDFRKENKTLKEQVDRLEKENTSLNERADRLDKELKTDRENNAKLREFVDDWEKERASLTRENEKLKTRVAELERIVQPIAGRAFLDAARLKIILAYRRHDTRIVNPDPEKYEKQRQDVINEVLHERHQLESAEDYTTFPRTVYTSVKDVLGLTEESGEMAVRLAFGITPPESARAPGNAAAHPSPVLPDADVFIGTCSERSRPGLKVLRQLAFFTDSEA